MSTQKLAMDVKYYAKGPDNDFDKAPSEKPMINQYLVGPKHCFTYSPGLGFSLDVDIIC